MLAQHVLCYVLKSNERRAIAKWNSHICRKCLYTNSCQRRVSVCDCVCICECVDHWCSSLSGWALCFWFFLFFSPFQCFPPFSYAARTSLEGLQSLSPSTNETPPPSPFLSSLLFLLPSLPPPPAPGYLYWSVGLLLCASLLFMLESAMLTLKAGLHSVNQTHQTSKFSVIQSFMKHRLHTQFL